MADELIKQIPTKGSQNWYRWDQRWDQRPPRYVPRDTSIEPSSLGAYPITHPAVRVREDGIVYDSRALTVYAAKPQVVELLKSANGTLTRSELRNRFGESTINAVVSLGLLI